MSPVGAVFTPVTWARWALDRLDAPTRVAGGAALCDPTAGEGAFAWALAEAWAGPSGAFDPAWARRVTLVDREGAFLEAFARRWRDRWGFAFPEGNLVETDVVTAPPDRRFDLLAGNPPWVTYPDLGPADQERYRPWFRSLGLVGRPGELLLGASRLDLAALVTARAFDTLAAPGCRAGFFLPLSLFHGQGTPDRWRRRYAADTVYDLTPLEPFPGVATRCGWAEFSPGPASATAPVRYWTGRPGAWEEHRAVTDGPGGSLRLLPADGPPDLPGFVLDPGRRPRQGINTGGANAAFHVAQPPPGVDPAFVHPLAPRGPRDKEQRWILVPYDRRGRILEADEVEASGLARHWEPWKDRLASRKGIFLGSQLARGRWWALLGVGAYAFAPWKVIWSAYGKSRLEARVWGPRDDGAVWQADQALQAFIPCPDEVEAQRVARFLHSPEVAAYLEGLRGAGTPNWAQPGRFKPLWRTPPGAGTPAGTTGS